MASTHKKPLKEQVSNRKRPDKDEELERLRQQHAELVDDRDQLKGNGTKLESRLEELRALWAQLDSQKKTAAQNCSQEKQIVELEQYRS